MSPDRRDDWADFWHELGGLVYDLSPIALVVGGCLVVALLTNAVTSI